MFSQDLANSMYKGEESEDNKRFHWEDELRIRGVHNIEVSVSNTYDLAGIHPVNGKFTHCIANMRVVNLCHEDNLLAVIAVSECLISSFSLDETSESFFLTIDLKDDEPFINPIVGIYIANRDIPRDLKNA